MALPIRLFERVAHAKSYLKFRPSYPPELFQKIISFMEEKRSPPHELHLDVGCGSGQSTYSMSSHFNRVIGFDISAAQVEVAIKAKTAPNVEFKVSPAEALPVEDHSVNLVTSGTAAHYFDFEAFCRECRRVLKPNGCLAVYSYGVPCLMHKDASTEKALKEDFNAIFHTTLGPFWNEKVNLIAQGYVDLNIPFPNFVRDASIAMRLAWSVSHLMGYIVSLSAYQRYLEVEPSGHILLKEYQKKVLEAVATSDASPDDTHLDVVFPIYLLMGRVS